MKTTPVFVRTIKYCICIGVYCLLCLPGIAQNKNFNFKHLSVQDGLSRSWVKCFLEDYTGLLWIGTGDGLNKFDGKNFAIYKYLPGLPKSLNHNNTNVIFEDSQKRLWIGTQAGLNYYQREMDEFIPMPFIDNYVTSIFELHKDTLLLGTAGGIFLFNTINRTAIQLSSSLYVEKIIKDTHGNIWITTHTGLMRFISSKKSVTSFKFNDNEPDVLYSGVLTTIYQDSYGGLWIGTSSQGLYYIMYPNNKLSEARFVNLGSDPTNQKHLTPGVIYAITEDEDKNLWVGIENGGINVLNLDAFNHGQYSFTKVLNNPSDFSSLSSNSIHALYTDKQNSIWVGTYAGGVNLYNKLLQRFGHHEALPGSYKSINDKYVSAILDEDAYLWIGTEKGLNRYDKTLDRWEYFIHDFKDPNSIGSNAVLDIMRDSDGRMWIGTYNGGLNLFNEKTKSFLKFKHDVSAPASISGNNIYQVLESSDHRIWVGTMGNGLAVYNPTEKSFDVFKENPNYNALSSNWVVDLAEDHLGNIWVSTTEAIDMFNPKNKHFTIFKHNAATPGSISYNGGTCLFKDSRNTVWIGTSNGLNYFVQKDSSFRHYTVDDGLPNNFIKAITEDNDGNIWFSTNNALTMFARGTTLPHKPVFKSFSVFDGLLSSEFVDHAAFRNRAGELYFGSTNGYFVFNPSDIKNNPNIPKIVFTDLRINNASVRVNTPDSPLEKDISVTQQLRLSKKQNVFTIGFAALNFIEPENNQYAFKLEGFDKQWNYVGHQQSATYTNLDPGTYTFRVRASNNDALWNEEGISMEIIILPAWWQTWFAKLAYLAIFIIAIFFFRKHTIISVNLKNVLWREHLEKQKSEELTQMKQQFFANVSHEIRTPLTLILGPLNKLIKEKRQVSELNTIFRNSTRLKMLVDQFLDFNKMESNMMMLSPTRTDIVEFTKQITANFIDYAGQRNIEMKLETSFSKCVTVIDQDKYEKILTNLLSNAVKSITGEGAVTTQLLFDDNSSTLTVRVIDTGRGITAIEAEHIFERYYSGANHMNNVHGTGIGLYLTRELVELQKGTIDVVSNVGEGSIFTVHIPIQVTEIEAGLDTIVFHTESAVAKKSNENVEGSVLFERTVLIIDDNADMCDYVETVLCDEFNVIKENNPLTGIDKILQIMPDLIISDVMMPDMDGFQLCRLIKEDVRFSHIPVILLTAKATKDDHIAGYQTGADDYVYKPFDEEILQARVKSLIARTEKLRQHFIGHDGIINPGTNANALDVKFMEDVLSEIKQNYTDAQFNVNQVIEKMGMSRSVFYKKFKSLSDQSINDLIKNIRLKKVASLLSNGDLTVSQVAYECGFTDPAYFSRVFKEHFSVAPKEFSSTTK